MSRGGKREGAGRKKGAPNKLTASIKQAIMDAFDSAGGVDYLIGVAHDDPRTFCALLGKIVPAEINASININNELDQRLIAGRERARTAIESKPH